MAFVNMATFCAALLGIGGTIVVQKATPIIRHSIHKSAHVKTHHTAAPPITKIVVSRQAVIPDCIQVAGGGGVGPLGSPVFDSSPLLQTPPEFSNVNTSAGGQPPFISSDGGPIFIGGGGGWSGGGGGGGGGTTPPGGGGTNPPSAVPEPSSWAMLILGFSIVGGIQRRQHNSAAITHHYG